jgi:hypothetical protein
MFGVGCAASRGAAARGAAIEDDPLATLPQALDMPVAAVKGQVMAEATDLLGLFQGSAATTSPQTAAPGGTGDGDILALFGAGDDAAPFEPGPAEAPKDDDILAMFEVPPEAAPTVESPGSPPHEGPAKEQDILDLFGGSPAAPDQGKGH